MTSSVQPPIEQLLADWFAARLATVTRENGYSIDLAGARIHTAGEPPPEENPVVPRAVYEDDSGTWEEVEDSDIHGILEFAPDVRLTIAADPATYKTAARAAWADVARACRFAAAEHLDADDVLPGVLSVMPAAWTRAVRAGNYVEIAITFAVRADGSAGIH